MAKFSMQGMNKPIVVADLHHSGLYYSLKLLIEDRLGGTLLRPIGMEWFDRGFWAIAEPYDNNIDTVKQYLWLKDEFKPVDGTLPLNKIVVEKPTHYEVQELFHNYIQKAITWEQFMSMDVDILIGSIPRHWQLYLDLVKKYKPKTKVIAQAGNMFNEIPILIREGYIKNLMAATIPFEITTHNVNVVFYHEEQPLRDFVEPPREPKIKSFVHLLPQPEIYQSYRRALPEVEFRAYGAQAPDGNLNGLHRVYDEMQNSSLIFHVKKNGDGYGWNFHSAIMLGRPIITNLSDYKDKLGGLLFKDLQTGIDLERRTFEENVKLIRTILEDRSLLLEMCTNAFATFREVVDYEEEAEEIRLFIARLQ